VQYLEGLQVMLFGMGLVFLALTSIMLVMIILERTFRYHPEDETVAAALTPDDSVGAAGLLPAAGETAAPAAAEDEVALAVALAVARARAGASTRIKTPPNGEAAALVWEWVWEHGLDDYGTAKRSEYANIYDQG
jgi:hypothetical protein